MTRVIKAETPSHFADASRLIDAYQRYIIERNLTMCMMGSLDDEILNPAAYYDPKKGGIFLAYAECHAALVAASSDRETRPRNECGVTETTYEPVGICCIEAHHPIHPDIQCAEIRRMYVAPAARGKKLGEALITACVSEAQKLGYTRVVLDTFQEPTYALKLYTRLGFTECAPFNHLPLDKAVWLEKML